KIITAVVAGKVGTITASFVNLLVRKGRESDLREIAAAFINQYNAIKGIHKVKLTTAVDISTEAAKAIGDRVKQANNFGSVELETVVDEKLIGGFVL
ncbi:F0F1 ATP synthase subunit delta, partial [Enterococcus lactis]|uniref:F0F1 ATP synthase subunit delta n=1 Tax=Enterococcus lactis TaxID=357441 RepID=UPI0034E945B5